MTCQVIGGAIICSMTSGIYSYAGWTFEMPRMTGCPWPLKQDGELRKRAGRKFYNDIKPFCDMSDEERERYRV